MNKRQERFWQRSRQLAKIIGTEVEGIKRIVVFGSLARGERYPRDADIGVYIEPRCVVLSQLHDVVDVVAPKKRFGGVKFDIVPLTVSSIENPKSDFHRSVSRDQIPVWP